MEIPHHHHLCSSTWTNEGPPPPYSPQYAPVSQSPNPYPSVPRVSNQFQSIIQQPPQSVQPVYQYQPVYSAQNQNIQHIQQYTQVQQSQPVTYVQQIPPNAQLQPGAAYQIVQPVHVNANANAYPGQQPVQRQAAPLQIVVDQRSNNKHLQQYNYESKAEEEQRPETKNFNWLYTLSCISCLLCCPLGSCSLYLACKASNQYEKKNYQRSAQNQRKSSIFAIIAIVLFIIIVSAVELL